MRKNTGKAADLLDKLKPKPMTSQLLIITRRLTRNLEQRASIEHMMPEGDAKQKQLTEIDESYYADLAELRRLTPGLSFGNLVIHDKIEM